MKEAYVVQKAHSHRPIKVFRKRENCVKWLIERLEKHPVEQPLLIFHVHPKGDMYDYVYTPAEMMN